MMLTTPMPVDSPTLTPPPRDAMLLAFMSRDAGFDGLFFTGVRTTGIFCRPTCSARKPSPANIEFFASAHQALFAGYRACKRCRPLEPAGSPPLWLRELLEAIETGDDTRRWTDADLVARGLEPERCVGGSRSTTR